MTKRTKRTNKQLLFTRMILFTRSLKYEKCGSVKMCLADSLYNILLYYFLKSLNSILQIKYFKICVFARINDVTQLLFILS